LKAAFKLDAKEGIEEWPSVAASLREGLSEMFTVNQLDLSAALKRCQVTINLIDSTSHVTLPIIPAN
jgi:hypothetical protein